MNPLQEWKKAKREEFRIKFPFLGTKTPIGPAPGNKLVEAFLDTSFDELVALVEAEVVPEEKFVMLAEDCGDCANVPQVFCRHAQGLNDSRERILQAFSRLRGETNDQTV